MNMRALTVILPVVLIGVLVLGSCSDSTSPESGPAYLQGTVTDGDGQPVAGAAIMISLRPSFEDVLQPFPIAVPDKDLPPSTLLSLRLFDPCDEIVRTVCDGDCGEMQYYSWDGLDDDGMRAVEGVYFFEAASADTVIRRELVLIHHYTEWDLEHCAQHALTDDDGTYRISDECLGFGIETETTDEEGNIIDTRPIQRLVNVHLLTPGGTTTRRDSIRWPEQGLRELDFSVTR